MPFLLQIKGQVVYKNNTDPTANISLCACHILTRPDTYSISHIQRSRGKQFMLRAQLESCSYCSDI